MPTALLPSFLVNSVTLGNQLAPSVARLSNGNFVVAWLTNNAGGGSQTGVHIRGRLFDADGTPIADEFVVNTSTGGLYGGLDDVEPSISALNNGGFVIAWANKSSQHDEDRSATAVRAQIFSADAAKMGAEFRVNTTTPAEQERAVVATLANGNFVVVWQDYSFSATAGDNRPPAVKAQIFTETGGRVGGEFLVNTTTPGAQYQADIAPLAGGGFVVVWQDESGFSVTLRAQVYTEGGQRTGPEHTLFSAADYRRESFGAEPKVTATGDGGFAVTWWYMNGNVKDATVQRYDASGNPLGDPITIRPEIGGANAKIDRPAISTTEDGRLIVVYAEADAVLYARLFNPDGSPDGEAFAVLDDAQPSRLPDITPLGGNMFLVTYERTSPFSDFRGDDSGSSVRARIIDAGLADQILRSGTPGNDLLRGGAGDDTLFGGDGTDTLIGGDGDDLLFGGTTGADLRDVIYGGDGNDTAYGGAGNDEIRGDAGNDLLFGDTGADTLIGGTGNDTLNGGSLGDVLFGGDGDDFLNGGFGFDRLNGGAGADTFFHLGVADHGSDWIQDYSAAEGDVLQFGNAQATRSQFQINTAFTPSAGSADVAEAFVIYRPTGQIIWALVDGAGQESINLRIGAEVFDLMG
jgi:hypothetical protein